MSLPLFVANWKMNKNTEEVRAFLSVFPSKVKELLSKAQIVLAPQALHLAEVVAKAKPAGIGVAAQNCGQVANGAFTGEVSPRALRDLGVEWVILGHSERRWFYHETNPLIESRLKAALEAGLHPILCIGERLVDRKEGRTFSVLEEQLAVITGLSLDKLVIAYEPVWAIGTGETATPAQAQEAHAFIRKCLRGKATRLLYGGSVKADNASALMGEKDVDGLLVGGASLDPMAFAELVRNGVSSQP